MALIKIKQINNTPASSGDVITFNGTNNVWAPGGDPDQNLFETVTADVGSTTANITTDTINIVGGTNVTTTIVGDTLTIDATGGGGGQPDQNLWETITADSGSVIANLSTDTLNILGTPDETVTSAASDNVIIGIADNPILPGTESTMIPTGTTAQRPVTPVAGMLRFNSTLNCTEEYDGTEWTCLRTQNSLVGGLYQMIFTVNGIIRNAWMDQGGDNILSDQTFAICLAKSKVVAFTFTNARTGVDVDLEIRSTPEGISPSVQEDLDFTWSLTATRSARKSNFVSDIIFEAGDKIGVFSNDPATGVVPNDAVFIVFLQYLEENNEEIIDNTTGDFA